MPFANILHDRFLSGRARGYDELDWSAIALVSQKMPEANIPEFEWLAGLWHLIPEMEIPRLGLKY